MDRWDKASDLAGVPVACRVSMIGMTRVKSWGQWRNWHSRDKQLLYKENATWTKGNGRVKEVKKPPLSPIQEHSIRETEFRKWYEHSMKGCRSRSAWGKAEGPTSMECLFFDRCWPGVCIRCHAQSSLYPCKLTFSSIPISQRNRFRLDSSLAYVHTLVSVRSWISSQVFLTPKLFFFLNNT